MSRVKPQADQNYCTLVESERNSGTKKSCKKQIEIYSDKCKEITRHRISNQFVLTVFNTNFAHTVYLCRLLKCVYVESEDIHSSDCLDRHGKFKKALAATERDKICLWATGTAPSQSAAHLKDFTALWQVLMFHWKVARLLSTSRTFQHLLSQKI